VCTRTEKTSGEASGGTPLCGFLLAAPKSGEGKTTVAVALMRALKNRGLAAQAFKCGPDYIDPGFHTAAAGRPSCNLDTWMMGKNGVRKLWASLCREADFGIAEGAMGLFDSIRPGDAAGSAADCARALHLPVILVFNARGMAWSVAALVGGFQRKANDMGVICGVTTNPSTSSEKRKPCTQSGGSTCRLDSLSVVRWPSISSCAWPLCTYSNWHRSACRWGWISHWYSRLRREMVSQCNKSGVGHCWLSP